MLSIALFKNNSERELPESGNTHLMRHSALTLICRKCSQRRHLNLHRLMTPVVAMEWMPEVGGRELAKGSVGVLEDNYSPLVEVSGLLAVFFLFPATVTVHSLQPWLIALSLLPIYPPSIPFRPSTPPLLRLSLPVLSSRWRAVASDLSEFCDLSCDGQQVGQSGSELTVSTTRSWEALYPL